LKRTGYPKALFNFLRKEFDFTSLEQKYYMQDNIINQLKRDIEEYKEQRRQRDEEINRLRVGIYSTK
jgi:hypothetical protein